MKVCCNKRKKCKIAKLDFKRTQSTPGVPYCWHGLVHDHSEFCDRGCNSYLADGRKGFAICKGVRK